MNFSRISSKDVEYISAWAQHGFTRLRNHNDQKRIPRDPKIIAKLLALWIDIGAELVN